MSQEGIEAALINMASIKPLDEKLHLEHARQTGAVVSAEERNIIGGLVSAVSEVLSVEGTASLARAGVKDTWGQSGSATELLERYKLNVSGIVQAAK